MRIFRDVVGSVSPDGGSGGSGDAPAEGDGRRKKRRRRKQLEFEEAHVDTDTRAHAEEVREVVAGRDIVDGAVGFDSAIGKPIPQQVGPILVRHWHRYRPLEADELPAPLMSCSSPWVTRHGRYCNFRVSGAGPCGVMRGAPGV